MRFGVASKNPGLWGIVSRMKILQIMGARRAAETADNVTELATDTFVGRDGKIVAQSFAAKLTPKG
jgi:hypothetical protein